MTINEICSRFELSHADVEAVCVSHGVVAEDLGVVPHPSKPSCYVSYGEEDEDVELLQCVEADAE